MNKSEQVLQHVNESINPAFAAAGGVLAWEFLKSFTKLDDKVLQIEKFTTYSSWQSRVARGHSAVTTTKIGNIYVATDAYQVIGMFSVKVHQGYIIVGKDFWKN